MGLDEKESHFASTHYQKIDKNYRVNMAALGLLVLHSKQGG